MALAKLHLEMSLEFDTTPIINLDVEYAASDGRMFEQEVVLNVEDTLTSTATVTAEQANNVRIDLSTLSSSRDYGNKYQALGWNVSYDIVPSFGDAALLILTQLQETFDSIIPLLISNKANYSFERQNNSYRWSANNLEHIETVNLSLTESLCRQVLQLLRKKQT